MDWAKYLKMSINSISNSNDDDDDDNNTFVNHQQWEHLLRNNLNVVLKRLAAEPFFGNYKLQTVGDVSINNHPRLGRARHLRVTRNKFN